MTGMAIGSGGKNSYAPYQDRVGSWGRGPARPRVWRLERTRFCGVLRTIAQFQNGCPSPLR